MPTIKTMLSLLNSRKSSELTDFESGIVYGLTMDRMDGAKIALKKICERVGFSPADVDDEAEGLEIKEKQAA